MSALLFASGVWVGGRTDQRREDVTRLSRAIEGEPVTAAVEHRILENAVTIRGPVALGGSRHAITSRSAASPPVVTAAPVAIGQQVQEGDVLLEISGRPIFVFGGDIPAYRDLSAGVVGRDVAAIEHALQRLGLLGFGPDDRFDTASADAVRRLYESAGYTPPGGGQVGLPLAEFVIVPGQQWSIADMSAAVGANVPETPMVLVDGTPVLMATVAEELGADLRAGQKTKVTVGGERLDGAVVAVQRRGGSEGEPVRIEVQIGIEGIDPHAVGNEGSARVVIDRTDEPVFIVPLSAVRTDGEGHDFVEVARGESREVTRVEVGLVNATHAEVRPVDPSKLRVGAEVVVD